MFRSLLIQSARCASTAALRPYHSASRIIAPCLFVNSNNQFTPPPKIQALRWYSAPAGLTQQEAEGRIVDLLKNFDKVKDPTKILSTSHFSNDLGLDSLDTVEVVMAIEEEFSIEIPDKEADKIHSVGQAVEYILAQPDAH